MRNLGRMEYITIISIMVTMTVWDFVIGVLFGIVVSCESKPLLSPLATMQRLTGSWHVPGFFFVVQNSQRRSIRTCYTGDTAISTVRRPADHRAYIREVSKQTRIIQLQGFLFFGTISHVEDTLRSLVDDPTFHAHPVRFVVVDFSLVAGVDLSAAEAFVRVQRLLAAKGVVLVFCGVSRAEVGKALRSVGVLEQPYVELFETLNDAMECESPCCLSVLVLTEYVTQGRRTHICARGLGRRKRRPCPLVSHWCTCTSSTTTEHRFVFPSAPGSSKGGRRLPRDPGRITPPITAQRRRRANHNKR